MYDITNFMNWWLGQVVRIFTYTFNTLDNIQFAGTSILKVSVFIIIIGALTKVVLTIPGQTINVGGEKKIYGEYKGKHSKEGYTPKHGKEE